MEVVGRFLKDRAQFRKRLFAGIEKFRRRPECDADRIAAIGYCIGGSGVLELARAGASLRGVVSLHGILTAPIPAQRNAILSKILVLHGDADPIASFDHVASFRDEMRSAEANWEPVISVVRGTALPAKVLGMWTNRRLSVLLPRSQ